MASDGIQARTRTERPLAIGILGTRGIPARYGGFETFAEELSARLVERGHSVTVYARRAFGSAPVADFDYRGVTVRTIPTILHKYLETPLHALMSFLDLFRRRFDVILLCNAANSPFAFLVRLRGLPLVINVDGIERERSKWNALGKLWYRVGEQCSVWFASRIVADAKVIADYYRQNYKCDSEVIAYGAEPAPEAPGETLSRFGLTAGRYFLYVARLEPENNALGVIEAYVSQPREMPLVIVGDAPYAKEYIASLRMRANSNVIFTGFQFEQAYRELRTNCYLYIQASEVGGTHPALVEAMAYGNCVIANDVPEHREVLGDSGRYYSKNNFTELSDLFSELSSDTAQVERLRLNARDRAEREYCWDAITARYENVCRTVCTRQSGAVCAPLKTKEN